MSELAGEDAVFGVLETSMSDCISVLDVGCGTGKYLHRLHEARPDMYLAGLDAHAASAAKVQADMVVVGTMPRVLSAINAKSFDAAMALDVIEHLDRHDAETTVRHLIAIARKMVLLFVPEGEHPQAGTDDNPRQAHRSTWRPDDLEALGFSVERWPEFHGERGAMWGIRRTATK